VGAFTYLKIMEFDGTFLLPDGTAIDNPQTLARHHGTEYIYDKYRRELEQV
jgi:hypothetical protein